MRHKISGRKLGRNSSHRKAMMRNMVTSLLDHEKITTTDARAKELRKIAEKMITLGKRGTLHARRQVMQVVMDKDVVGKLFKRLAPVTLIARVDTLGLLSSVSARVTMPLSL